MQKSSVIRCRKCGHVSNIISDTCIKCGAGLEKVCGECGFANAVEKNYCDQCGSLLALRAQTASAQTGTTHPAQSVKKDPGPGNEPKFHFELQPIQDTIAERDASFRARPADAAQARPSAQRPPAPPVMPPRTDRDRRPAPARDRLHKALFFSALLAALALILYLIASPHLPRLSLKITASNYLGKLAAGRYEDAYEFLSTNSKSACSKPDFVNYSREYYGRAPAWEFRDVKVFAMEPAAAMIQYQLKEGSGTWRTDYVSFVREHDKWTRPYIWMLFEPLDLALAKQDYPQALFLAQKLYLTDPMDPRASGYLCVAEFFMGLYDKSADSCRKTVVSAATYPVGFSPEEIFWYKFYYADSLRFTGKFDLALEEYGELLGGNGLSMKEQCPLFLSQADALVQVRRYDSALNSMLKADGVCFGDVNRVEVTKRMRFMNGDARAEAISFAQRTKARPDLPSFGDLRRLELARLAAPTGGKGARTQVRDSWVAAHIAGPEYRVVLRQEGSDPSSRMKEVRDVYTFMVNLWTGQIKLEEGAPPATGNDSD